MSALEDDCDSDWQTGFSADGAAVNFEQTLFLISYQYTVAPTGKS